MQNPNEMKGSSRKNNLNSLSEKDEDSRINDKKELSAFDELPYDFSQTDKIHRVSDLLRFLGIEDKKDDDGLMVILKFHNIISIIIEYAQIFHLFKSFILIFIIGQKIK